MMFMFTSTHVAAMAAKDAEITKLEASLVRETQRANRLAGKWADTMRNEAIAQIDRATMKRQRDALQAKVDRMQGGLKQYRKAPAVEQPPVAHHGV